MINISDADPHRFDEGLLKILSQDREGSGWLQHVARGPRKCLKSARVEKTVAWCFQAFGGVEFHVERSQARPHNKI